MKIELLWFEDCPNHHRAEILIKEVLAENELNVEIGRIEVPDLETGARVNFPGSPTLRVDGVDVEPDWQDSGDYTPRCRLYFTRDGITGVPQRDWIENAVKVALKS
jgi:hypothetical protein